MQVIVTGGSGKLGRAAASGRSARVARADGRLRSSGLPQPVCRPMAASYGIHVELRICGSPAAVSKGWWTSSHRAVTRRSGALAICGFEACAER